VGTLQAFPVGPSGVWGRAPAETEIDAFQLCEKNRNHKITKTPLTERLLSCAESRLPLLEQEVISEINESYLFHGTKADTVGSILYDGIDNRLGGDRLLFGRGAYFAETTTKADQYPGKRYHIMA